MSTPSEPQQVESSAFKPFAISERIQQLNNIDKSVAQLLRLAHEATQILTTIKQSDTEPGLPTPKNRREAFQSTTEQYLDVLHSVDVRMKRQIWGLEETGIIPDKLKHQFTSGSMSDRAAKGETPGGERNMGKLDVGWLNSRSGKVERDIEAELWRKARLFLEGLDNGTSEGHCTKEERGSDGDVSMKA